MDLDKSSRVVVDGFDREILHRQYLKNDIFRFHTLPLEQDKKDLRKDVSPTR